MILKLPHAQIKYIHIDPSFSCQALTLRARNLRYCGGVPCERHVGNSLDAIRRGYGYFHANADNSFFAPPTWNNSDRIRSRRNRASKLSGLMRKRPIAREYKHFLKRGRQGGVDSFTIEDFGVISPVNKIVHFAH